MDRYADRISYLYLKVLNAPQKGSDNFNEWMKEFRGWVAGAEVAREWFTQTEAFGAIRNEEHTRSSSHGGLERKLQVT